jgi:hypothetical protein
MASEPRHGDPRGDAKTINTHLMPAAPRRRSASTRVRSRRGGSSCAVSASPFSSWFSRDRVFVRLATACAGSKAHLLKTSCSPDASYRGARDSTSAPRAGPHVQLRSGLAQSSKGADFGPTSAPVAGTPHSLPPAWEHRGHFRKTRRREAARPPAGVRPHDAHSSPSLPTSPCDRLCDRSPCVLLPANSDGLAPSLIQRREHPRCPARCCKQSAARPLALGGRIARGAPLQLAGCRPLHDLHQEGPLPEQSAGLRRGDWTATHIAQRHQGR